MCLEKDLGSVTKSDRVSIDFAPAHLSARAILKNTTGRISAAGDVIGFLGTCGEEGWVLEVECVGLRMRYPV